VGRIVLVPVVCGHSNHSNRLSPNAPKLIHSLPPVHSRGAIASLDSAKWACLDSVLVLAAAVAAEARAHADKSGTPSGTAAALASMNSVPVNGGQQQQQLLPAAVCRRLLVEALDVLQYCMEGETVVVLRCLRRCWCQLIWASPEEQVGEWDGPRFEPGKSSQHLLPQACKLGIVSRNSWRFELPIHHGSPYRAMDC
jgi:hypothetical protein